MNCPSCGSPMVLRTAKRGKYAGHQFWGCSNYPTCKEIMDISTEDEGILDSEKQSNNANDYLTELDLPVFLQAREKFRGFQVKFFETLALPKVIFDRISYEELNGNEFKTLNKWRIDFPTKSNSNVDPNLKQILTVA